MNARVAAGKAFRMTYSVGGKVQPPVLVVDALDVDAADRAVLLHAAGQAGYGGEEVRILAVDDLEASTRASAPVLVPYPAAETQALG
jgi:hypothetical protein